MLLCAYFWPDWPSTFCRTKSKTHSHTGTLKHERINDSFVSDSELVQTANNKIEDKSAAAAVVKLVQFFNES